ncbi:MAG: hypothetical protein ACYC3X_29330 [Pirellulaceae bacterium]
MKRSMISVMSVVLTCFGWASTQASVTITAYDSPWGFDEKAPRGVEGIAPSGWGTSSWQGPVAGPLNKTNYYVPTSLTGSGSVSTSELTSLSYWTMRNTPHTDPNMDWFVQIYTTPTGTGDAASWYHSKYIGSTGTHGFADDNSTWTQWSTGATGPQSLEFAKYNFNTLSGGWGTLGAVAESTETILYISLQTASPWNGFDGYVDGLSFILAGNTVNVDLAAVPEPASMAVWGLLGLVVAGCGMWRRKRAA